MIPVLKLRDEAVLEPPGAVLGRKNVRRLRLLRHTILFIKRLGNPWSRNVLLNILVGHCGLGCQRVSLQGDCYLEQQGCKCYSTINNNNGCGSGI